MLLPQVAITIGGSRQIVFNTPNRLTLWRAKTLFQKEPETIEWISRFKTDEIFLDIGANVGIYSILAAATRGVNVFAFEPEAQNYALLNKNIISNGLSAKITGYCAALSDADSFAKLYLNSSAAGDSGHTIGESLDHNLRKREIELVQGGISVRLDHLVESAALPVPNHIKIDVDGLEHKVISGAETVLRCPALRSILVELNTLLPQHLNVVEILSAHGFTCQNTKTVTSAATEGKFKGLANHIFYR
jgi:FkbM family methyltransferase